MLTHFPPADTYNGQADVKEALFAVSNNKDRDRSSSLLHLIGYGGVRTLAGRRTGTRPVVADPSARPGPARSMCHASGPTRSNGDGGGGPLPDMIERVERMSNTFGLPRMSFSHPDRFFDGLNNEAGDKLLTVRRTRG